MIVIRHGRTNENPAFPRDVPPTNLVDCSGQTMLTEAGQDQARAIGAAFRTANIPVGKVLASGLCRAMETGRLAFGRAEASDALLIESFMPAAGTPEPPPWPRRVQLMKAILGSVPEAGTNTVLITHFPNIRGSLGMQINFGDAAVVNPTNRAPSRSWGRSGRGIGRGCEAVIVLQPILSEDCDPALSIRRHAIKSMVNSWPTK